MSLRHTAGLLGAGLLATLVPLAPAGATDYSPAGTVSAWGGFDAGQTSIPSKLDGRDVIAVSAGPDTSLALTRDGAVTGWGWNGEGQAAPPWDLDSGRERTVGIDAGDHHSLAVLADGSVRAWGAAGQTDEGQADVPAQLQGPAPTVRVAGVSAGRYHSLALTRDGRVVGWGAEERHGAIDDGQADVPVAVADGEVTAVGIAAGGRHSLAVDEFGRVWAWGADDRGQTDVPPMLEVHPVAAVAAYGSTSMALTRDGGVFAWGDDGTGLTALPDALAGRRVVALDVGSEVAVALTDDGRVITWGDSATAPAGPVAQHAPYSAIAAGGRHVLVVHRTPLPDVVVAPPPRATTRLTLRGKAKVVAGRPLAVRLTLDGTAGGTVVVADRGRRLVTVTVAGTAHLRLPKLGKGKHVLTASYDGSATADAARSTPLRVRVMPRRR